MSIILPNTYVYIYTPKFLTHIYLTLHHQKDIAQLTKNTENLRNIKMWSKIDRSPPYQQEYCQESVLRIHQVRYPKASKQIQNSKLKARNTKENKHII